jgi:hypothetical protein
VLRPFSFGAAKALPLTTRRAIVCRGRDGWTRDHERTNGQVDGFYTGFSNSSLWPLLHWMTPYARFSNKWCE